MKNFVFDLQRFENTNNDKTNSDALDLMHDIIQRFDLKNAGNSTLKFIGTFWGALFFKKSTRTTEVNALTTMLACTVSIVEDIYAIREEKNKANPSEVIITSKAEDYISNLASLTNAFQKLVSGKNSFILSIVSSIVGLTANLVLSMDGLKENEVEKINKSYVSLLQVSGGEIIKKFFTEGLADILIKMPVSQILDNPVVKDEIRKQTASNFTKGSGPLGLIFAAITGVLNGANEYDSRIKKYTEDGIPEDITKHDARIDAIATFVHDTASYYAKGFDDTVFKWIQAGLSFVRGGEDIPYYTDKNYVEVIADWVKTLNYKNSGTSNDDKVIYVLENKSMVYGDDGDDYIGNYGFSNVTIWGGHDDDTLGSYKTDSATPQNNSIFGGPGDDQISVYDKDSTIYGGTGKDFINVVGTNNEIFGDADDDKFYIANGANNNTLSGDTGDDFIVMLEEAKNTTIKYSSGDGNDTIFGFNEDDSLKISDSYKTTVDGNHLKITVGEGSILLVDMAGKNININGKTIKSGEENDRIYNSYYSDNSTISGDTGADIILNNGGKNVSINGDAGNDSIDNRGDEVSINGGAGNDSIYNSYGDSVTIDGGSGNDSIILSYYSQNNLIQYTKGDGNDTIIGFNADDTLSISGGSYLTTKSNDDIIVTVGEGKISLIGAASLTTVHIEGVEDSSSDSKLITLTAGNNNYSNTVEGATINALDGDDSIYNNGSSVSIDGGAGNDLITTEYGNKVTISGGAGNDSIYNNGSSVSIDGGAGNDLITTEYGNKVTISGGSGDDTLSGYTGNDKLLGGAGNDSLNGGSGNDTLSGYTGNDKLLGGAGNDSLSGGDGADTLSGGSGNDKLLGGAGNDSLNGGDGADTLSGGSGNDKLLGGAGNDSLSGGAGNDTLTGGAGADKLLGGAGNDSLSGGAGNDTLTGGAGADKLLGGAGNDSLSGGAGDDSLWGGAGNDILIGGDGADIFYYTTGDGKDTISGFANNDTLNLDGLEFTSAYKNNAVTLTFNSGSITLKNFTATTFHIDNDTYKISGGKLAASS